jgi:ribosomal protein L12E/L44/L45/RPP1/RPP2
MTDNKRMTEEEIDDLVKKTMDEVMASITPALEAKHTEYMEKRAKERAEDEEEDER